MKCVFFGFTHNNRKGGPFFRIRLNFKMKSVSVDWKDLDLNALNEITFKDFKKKKKWQNIKIYIGSENVHELDKRACIAIKVNPYSSDIIIGMQGIEN